MHAGGRKHGRAATGRTFALLRALPHDADFGRGILCYHGGQALGHHLPDVAAPHGLLQRNVNGGN